MSAPLHHRAPQLARSLIHTERKDGGTVQTNDEVAALLTEYADLTSITGGDRFRIRTYERAARSVAGYPADLGTLDEKGLREIPNVGASVAAKIEEYLRTGAIGQLEELRAKVPAGVRRLTEIPGLGPKRAMALYTDLGIDSVDGLPAAVGGYGMRALHLRRVVAPDEGHHRGHRHPGHLRPAVSSDGRGEGAAARHPGGGQRPDQDHDRHHHRAPGGPAGRAPGQLGSGAAVLHRIPGAQHPHPRDRGPRQAQTVRVWAVRRRVRRQDRLGHRGGGLRAARAALDPSDAARGQRGDRCRAARRTA